MRNKYRGVQKEEEAEHGKKRGRKWRRQVMTRRKRISLLHSTPICNGQKPDLEQQQQKLTIFTSSNYHNYFTMTGLS